MALRDSLPGRGIKPNFVQMQDFADAIDEKIHEIPAGPPGEPGTPGAPGGSDESFAEFVADPGTLTNAAVTAQTLAQIGSVLVDDYIGEDDDYAAGLVAAVAAADGGGVRHVDGKRYLAKTSASIVDQDVRLMGAATIVRATTAGNVPTISVSYTLSTAVTVTSLTVEDYAYETGATTPVHVLNVADSSGFAAGDRVKVLSDDPMPWSTTAPVEKMAEILTVMGTAAGKIYLRRLLQIAPVTNIRVTKLTPGVVDWDHLTFEDETPDAAGLSAPAVVLTGAVEPRLTRGRMQKLRGAGLKLVSCYRPSTKDLTGEGLKTDAANSAYAYLVWETGGTTDGRHEGLAGDNIRHLYTTGATDNLPALSPQLENYGGALGTMIKLGWGGETTSAAFDAHPDAIGLVFSDIDTTRSFQDAVGALYGIQLRGKGHIVRNASTRVRGISLRGDGTGADFTIDEHTHLAPAGYTGVTACRANFGAMPARGKTRRRARTLGSGCSGYIEWYTNADIVIPYMEIAVDSPLVNFRPFVLSNSRVAIDTLVVTGMPAGEVAPIFTLQDATSSVHVRNLRVTAGTTWRIANLGGFDGSVTVDSLEADVTPNDSATAGMQNAGAGATYWIKDGVIGTSQIRDGITTRTDGTATSTLTAFAGRTIRLSAPLTATRTLTLPVGVPVGTEVLVVRAAGATGAFNWNIQSSATVLEAEKTWVRMKLLGANWSSVSRGTLP